MSDLTLFSKTPLAFFSVPQQRYNIRHQRKRTHDFSVTCDIVRGKKEIIYKLCIRMLARKTSSRVGWIKQKSTTDCQPSRLFFAFLRMLQSMGMGGLGPVKCSRRGVFGRQCFIQSKNYLQVVAAFSELWMTGLIWGKNTINWKTTRFYIAKSSFK